MLTWRLCGFQSQFGCFGGDRKHAPFPEFEPWNRPAHSVVRRSTLLVFLKKSQVEKVSNLHTNGCYDYLCSFVYPSLQDLGVMYFISSCENVSKESIMD